MAKRFMAIMRGHKTRRRLTRSGGKGGMGEKVKWLGKCKRQEVMAGPSPSHSLPAMLQEGVLGEIAKNS